MALALIIALPFLGICLPLLLERFGRSACAFGAGIAPLTALILLLSKRADVFAGQTEIVHYSWLPGLGLNLSLRLDGLGFLFALLILGIGLLVGASAVACAWRLGRARSEAVPPPPPKPTPYETTFSVVP